MRRKHNPSSGDTLLSLVLLGALGVGGYYLVTQWDKITNQPGWQCRHPVTPAAGKAGLAYVEGRCGWVDASGKLVYLADGQLY